MKTAPTEAAAVAVPLDAPVGPVPEAKVKKRASLFARLCCRLGAHNWWHSELVFADRKCLVCMNCGELEKVSEPGRSGEPLTWCECREMADNHGLGGVTGAIYAGLLRLRGVRWE